MLAGTPQSDRLMALIGPVVDAEGCDLEDIAVSPAGRRTVVRVVVDRDDGVSLDKVADLSRAISATLDTDTGVLGDRPYVLQVTSPGVDRPLREPRQWRRATGRLVEVTVEGAPVTGRVVRADDEAVDLAVGDEEQRYSYDVLGDGHVRVEFGRPAGEGEPS